MKQKESFISINDFWRALFAFYMAIARRIVPAIIFLGFVLIAFGWFMLGKADYLMLAKNVSSTILFVSNFQYWKEVGYFDIASHDKFLLHTWSLSVEWQFYIIYPIFLALLWRCFSGVNAEKVIVSVFFAASLILSALLTPIMPAASFFLLPTRAWEMLIGTMVYLYAKKLTFSVGSARVAEFIGFTLIILSLVLFDSGTTWPGWRASLPVFGTVLVILSSRHDSIVTNNILAQWLGSISYSLYLWHWPICVALSYLQMQKQTGPIFISFVLMALIAWFSWRYIENTIRNKMSELSLLGQLLIFAISILSLLTVSLYVYMHNGVPGRISNYAEIIFSQADNKNPDFNKCFVVNDIGPVPECIYGGGILGAIVLGDSHAASVIRSVQKALPVSKDGVLDWTLGSCPTIFRIKETGGNFPACEGFLDYAFSKSKEMDPAIPLLIVNRYSVTMEGANEKIIDTVPNRFVSSRHYSRTEEYYSEISDGIVNTACAFAQHRTVYMLRPIPEMKIDVPRVMGRAVQFGLNKRVQINLEEYYLRHKRVLMALDTAAARCGVKLLDPIPFLCVDGSCWGDVAGLPIYYDDDHLNEYGAQFLIPLFRQIN
jgi:peptidoglycan/LPS O-acetylase OafA/YrhL